MNLKYYLFFLSFVVSSFSSAQKITKVVDKDACFIGISAVSETEGYDNICIILRDKTSANFVRNLKLEMNKIGKWQRTAKKHQVTDFSKKLANDYSIDNILFDYDGHSYSAKSKSTDLFFVVDENGKSYLRIQKNYQGGIGTDYFSISSGIGVGGAVVTSVYSESSLMKRVSFNYIINIPLEDSVRWVEELDNKSRSLIEERKELKKAEKKKEKLFE